MKEIKMVNIIFLLIHIFIKNIYYIFYLHLKGKTAFMLAIIEQNIEIVDILLSRNDLDLFIVDFKSGNLFLHFACHYYNEEIFNVIIRWLRVKDKLINSIDSITDRTINTNDINLDNKYNSKLLSMLIEIENYQGFTANEILDELIRVKYEDTSSENNIKSAKNILNLMNGHYQNENFEFNIDYEDEEKINYL
jgi:ankyrin repeat protein